MDAPKYTLNNIDPDLWRQVKARAASEGRSLRFVILRLLRVYAEHGLDAVVETFTRRQPYRDRGATTND